jgi:hypothetical protein
MVERTDLEPFIFISYPIAVEALLFFCHYNTTFRQLITGLSQPRTPKRTFNGHIRTGCKRKADLLWLTQIVWPSFVKTVKCLEKNIH